MLVAMLGGGCLALVLLYPPGKDQFQLKPGQWQELTLLTTAYCSCQKCCGWELDSRGRPVYNYGPNKGMPKQIGVTASGTRAKKGTIAADTRIFPFGTRMFVPGYGYGVVEDRGGAIKGRHIDLYFPTHQQALAWGRQAKKVRIWIDPAE